jgi:hypothetical protein
MADHIATTLPWLEAALTPEKLVERALLDHVIALLEILRPCSEREAIRLLGQLTAVIEKGSRS